MKFERKINTNRVLTLICSTRSGRLQSPGYRGSTTGTSDWMTRPLWQMDWLKQRKRVNFNTCPVPCSDWCRFTCCRSCRLVWTCRYSTWTARWIANLYTRCTWSARGWSLATRGEARLSFSSSRPTTASRRLCYRT